MSEVASSRKIKSSKPFQAAKPWWVDQHNEGDIEVASIHASQSLTHRTYSRVALSQPQKEIRLVTPQVQVEKRWSQCSDAEIQTAVEDGQIKFFDLEKELEDEFRAVKIRRSIIAKRAKKQFSALPYEHFDYQAVVGQSCENVIGYATIPVGVAGPLLMDGKEYYVPMATTEGALVASTTRGCKAISMSGGASTVVYGDGMSRAPVLGVPDVRTGAAIKFWVESNFSKLADSFNSTSRYARLVSVNTFLAGRKVFIRFKCSSGDAMGMNMIGKGVEKALETIKEKFPSASVLSLSGNVCTDKKTERD
jgi:hydroxymethylglutaryl-CoA reductase (NADPH)